MGYKWILIILFTSIITITSKAQSKEVRFLLDTSITIMKEKAVNSRKVNWSVIKKTAFDKARNITDPYQLGSVIRYLFQSLNDFHGAFFYKDSTFKWHRKELPVPDSIMNEWNKGVHIQTQKASSSSYV